MRRLAPVAAALALVLLATARADAAPRWSTVGDFDVPVHVTGPPGDAARLFVVEKAGRVRVVVNGQKQANPFLDVTAQVADGEERGLLSIAFPSDYATSGRFYVFATASEGGFHDSTLGDLVVAEGRRSGNPNRADGTMRVLLRVPHPAGNHNGGQLAFGPDGALYASTGDGGNGGDPADAQRPSSRLGKILQFAAPATTAAPITWARGLRNPWRFSFDRVTGDVWIGDVGDATEEEVDRLPFAAAANANYGWPICEGTVDHDGSCATVGLTRPRLGLPRSEFNSVIGGHVVRDPGVPSLAGRYLFGDLSGPNPWSVGSSGGYRAESSLAIGDVLSFGEDGCGRVHVATPSAVLRLTEVASTACVPPVGQGPPPGGEQPPPAPGSQDTTKPAVKVKKGKRRVRVFVVKLRSAEAARAIVKARGYKTRRVELAAGVTRAVKVKAMRGTVRKLRDRRRVVRTVRIRVVDAAGNATVKTPRFRLR